MRDGLCTPAHLRLWVDGHQFFELWGDVYMGNGAGDSARVRKPGPWYSTGARRYDTIRYDTRVEDVYGPSNGRDGHLRYGA